MLIWFWLSLSLDSTHAARVSDITERRKTGVDNTRLLLRLPNLNYKKNNAWHVQTRDSNVHHTQNNTILVEPQKHFPWLLFQKRLNHVAAKERDNSSACYCATPCYPTPMNTTMTERMASTSRVTAKLTYWFLDHRESLAPPSRAIN